MVYHSAERVGQAVIADVHHEVQIVSADGFLDGSLSLSGTKTGGLCLDDVVIPLISGKCNGGFVLALPLPSPLYQMSVHLFPQLRAALQRDQSQWTDRYRFDGFLFVNHLFPPIFLHFSAFHRIFIALYFSIVKVIPGPPAVFSGGCRRRTPAGSGSSS